MLGTVLDPSLVVSREASVILWRRIIATFILQFQKLRPTEVKELAHG